MRNPSAEICGPPRAPGRAERRVVVVDHYDSFTFNLVQALGVLGTECTVLTNDVATPDRVLGLAPDGILLSPGAGTPDDSGYTRSVIARAAGRVPVLGVCLGHQALAVHYGATIVASRALKHGKRCAVAHYGTGLFAGIPSPFQAARYNSLSVDPASLPATLAITAMSDDGETMAVAHQSEKVQGVQFHPESVLTEFGLRLLLNWLRTL